MRNLKHISAILAIVCFGFTIANAATLTPVNPTCNGSSNGSITVAGVSGGAGPSFTYYLYNANPVPGPTFPIDQFGPTANVSHTFSGLPAHKYWIIVTDNIGDAILYAPITLTEPDVTTLPAPNITDASCNGLADGKISVLAAGGTMPYTYILKKGAAIIQNSGAQPGAYTFSGLAAGNDYSVTVDDANTCGVVISGLLTITEPTAI